MHYLRPILQEMRMRVHLVRSKEMDEGRKSLQAPCLRANKSFSHELAEFTRIF